MALELTKHRDTPCEAVARLGVAAVRPAPAKLILRYTLEGALALLNLPPAGLPRREDGLWRHTCFEAFVRAGASRAYLELNFSPSTAWAAYRFEDYRTGMAPAQEIEPRTVHASAGDVFMLHAEVDLPAIARETWRLALSAVIEETGGRLSYWAVAHSEGKPDFHHADGFALNLPGDAAP